MIHTDGTTALTERQLLKLDGTPVVAGQFGTWSPIGTVQMGTAYKIAWKDSASGEFTIWTTDSTGNYLSTLIPSQEPALQSRPLPTRISMATSNSSATIRRL